MTTNPKPAAARVRKHRQRLRAAGSVRLEVSLGADVAADIKALAASQGLPVWKTVEDALVAYVTGNREFMP